MKCSEFSNSSKLVGQIFAKIKILSVQMLPCKHRNYNLLIDRLYQYSSKVIAWCVTASCQKVIYQITRNSFILVFCLHSFLSIMCSTLQTFHIAVWHLSIRWILAFLNIYAISISFFFLFRVFWGWNSLFFFLFCFNRWCEKICLSCEIFNIVKCSVLTIWIPIKSLVKYLMKWKKN